FSASWRHNTRRLRIYSGSLPSRVETAADDVLGTARSIQAAKRRHIVAPRVSVGNRTSIDQLRRSGTKLTLFCRPFGAGRYVDSSPALTRGLRCAAASRLRLQTLF